MRAYLKPLLVFGALLILVVAVSWIAFPGWHAQPGGFWLLIGAAMVGVVGIVKDGLDIARNFKELREKKSPTPTTRRRPATQPRQEQRVTRSEDVDQEMTHSGGNQKQVVDDSKGVRQSMK